MIFLFHKDLCDTVAQPAFIDQGIGPVGDLGLLILRAQTDQLGIENGIIAVFGLGIKQGQHEFHFLGLGNFELSQPVERHCPDVEPFQLRELQQILVKFRDGDLIG